MTRGGGSGGLPIRPTWFGLGAPKARGPQGSEARKLGVPKARRLSDPKGLVPTKLGFLQGLGPPRIRGPHGLGAPMGWGLLVTKYNSDLEAEFGTKIIHFHEHLQSLQKKKSSANPKTVIADICEILNSTAEVFPNC
jgi:hypothetical protein